MVWMDVVIFVLAMAAVLGGVGLFALGFSAHAYVDEIKAGRPVLVKGSVTVSSAKDGDKVEWAPCFGAGDVNTPCRYERHGNNAYCVAAH